MNDDHSIIANFGAISPGRCTPIITSTIGSSVSTPGRGTFRCDAGKMVDLLAVSEEGYKFFNWTGEIENIEMIASVNIGTSTRHWQTATRFSITREGNYATTADFIPRWFSPTG